MRKNIDVDKMTNLNFLCSTCKTLGIEESKKQARLLRLVKVQKSDKTEFS